MAGAAKRYTTCGRSMKGREEIHGVKDGGKRDDAE